MKVENIDESVYELTIREIIKKFELKGKFGMFRVIEDGNASFTHNSIDSKIIIQMDNL